MTTHFYNTEAILMSHCKIYGRDKNSPVSDYEANDTGEVTKCFCKVCREFFSTEKKSADLKGRVQGQVDKYIEVNFFYF